VNRRRATVVAAAVLAGVPLVGVAHAYLTTAVSGTGTGSATPSNATMTFTLTAPTTALMYPGAPASTVTANVTNPFAQALTVTSVVMTPTATGGSGTCLADNFTTSSSSIPATLPTGTNAYSVSVAMDADAVNACQGKTVTLAVTINGKL
jgi:hypothetical protein